jgi:hypothetical protein
LIEGTNQAERGDLGVIDWVQLSWAAKSLGNNQKKFSVQGLIKTLNLLETSAKSQTKPHQQTVCLKNSH